MPPLRAVLVPFVLLSVVLPGRHIALAQSAVAAQFDTTRTVTIAGTVNEVMFPAGRSYLAIETKSAAGATEKVVVQGNGLGVLKKAGWSPKGTVPLGAAVSVTAYRPRPGADLTAALPPGSPEVVLEAAMAGRLLSGIEVTLPDGRKLPFGPAK